MVEVAHEVEGVCGAVARAGSHAPVMSSEAAHSTLWLLYLETALSSFGGTLTLQRDVPCGVHTNGALRS